MKWIRSVLRYFFVTVALLAFALLFYVIIVMGDAPKIEEEVLEPSATFAPLSAGRMQLTPEETVMVGHYFGAKVLRLPEYSSWRLENIDILEDKPKGLSHEVRVVSFQYVDDTNGNRVTTSSCTPSDVIQSLTARGFSVTPEQDLSISDLRSVLMRKGNTLNLHATRDDIAYMIEGDISLEDMEEIARVAGLS